MVSFEKFGDEPLYVDGDDDSGFESISLIRERLYRGREYILRIHLYFRHIGGDRAVFMY